MVSPRGLVEVWWRWSSRSDTGVLNLVWDFSDLGESIV